MGQDGGVRAKVRLMVAVEEGLDESALGPALRAEADRALSGRPQPGPDQRVGLRLADERLRDVAHGPYYRGGPGFDAMLELTADGHEGLDALLDALDGFAARLDGLIDPERSAAVAGVAHDVIPGSGPVHVTVAARRLPRLTHEEYVRHWFENHADVARSIDSVVVGLSYRQFHGDLERSRRAADRAGVGIDDFDGMSEAYFDDAEALARVCSGPGVWAAAYADERRFVDHSRSVLSLLRIGGP